LLVSSVMALSLNECGCQVRIGISGLRHSLYIDQLQLAFGDTLVSPVAAIGPADAPSSNC
jgi:hypothetical protein